MTADELKGDSEFAKAWPNVWRKLRPYILLKQQQYAKNNKGKHAEIGQFVEFTEELFEDLESIQPQIENQSMPTKPERPKLNNAVFKPATPAGPPATLAPHGQNPNTIARKTHGTAARLARP